MIATLAAIGYLLGMGWLFVRRRFVFVLLAVLVVGFTARFTSVVYLDLAGPVYSEQLFRDVGGGTAAPALLLTYLIYFSAFLFVFRTTTLRKLAAAGDRLLLQGPTTTDRRIAAGVFWVYVAFVALLFFDLFRKGVIPVFVGLERFEYTELYGGVWHRLLMSYGMLLALPLGAFYSLGVFFRMRGDNRFLFLLIALFGYLFLAGHRFSAFYTHSAAFVMPYAAVVCWQQFTQLMPESARRRQRVIERLVVAGAAVVMVVLITSALYISYFFTRSADRRAPLEAFTHRVFVQQGELWYATWDRVISSDYHFAETAVRLFIDPVSDPNRNTTIAYLMVAEIGDKAYTTLDVGSTYSGGFPEILFELTGPAAFAVVLVVALLTAWLMKILVLALLERRYLRLALCWYVLFAFVLIPLSGMLNFLVNWKYGVKVTAFVGWVAIETDRDRLRQWLAPKPRGSGGALASPTSDRLA